MRQNRVRTKGIKQKTKNKQKINLSDIYNWRVMYVNTMMTKCSRVCRLGRLFVSFVCLDMEWWQSICTCVVCMWHSAHICFRWNSEWRINVNKYVSECVYVFWVLSGVRFQQKNKNNNNNKTSAQMPCTTNPNECHIQWDLLEYFTHTHPSPTKQIHSSRDCTCQLLSKSLGIQSISSRKLLSFSLIHIHRNNGTCFAFNFCYYDILHCIICVAEESTHIYTVQNALFCNNDDDDDWNYIGLLFEHSAASNGLRVTKFILTRVK